MLWHLWNTIHHIKEFAASLTLTSAGYKLLGYYTTKRKMVKSRTEIQKAYQERKNLKKRKGTIKRKE